MKWRGSKDRYTLLLIVIALAGLLWLSALAQDPPSSGLWRDVRCEGQAWSEANQAWLPTECQVVYRLYPELGAWLWEFFVEPFGGETQDW